MEQDNSTKKELFKATTIIGGTQVISILLGLVRTKAIAILLGPAGIGIAGILQSIVETIRNATCFGLNFSSVKDIAQANEAGDEQKVAATITTLRRWVVFTGLLGMAITIVLCVPLSNYSFDNPGYAISIAIVSVTILTNNIFGGQIALLQGLRRIKEMAKATLWGAIGGTVTVLPIYWWLGLDGIVPAMVAVSLVSLGVSWWYSRKIKLLRVELTIKQTYKQGVSMAKFGFFIVVSSFLSYGIIYVMRIFIVSQDGIDAAGYFQAVWTITNAYLGLVLNSMLADFFPRLSGQISNKERSIELVNSQMELTLLVGGILVVALMTFSDLALNILYSSQFVYASAVLQWQMLGSLIIFVCWPISVIFLSAGKGLYTVIVDAGWYALYFALVYFGWDYFGFLVLGVAYFASSLAKLIVVCLFGRKLIGYKISRTNIKYISLLSVSAAVILALRNLVDNTVISMVSSSLIAFCVIFYCLTELNKHLGLIDIIKRKILKRN